MRERERERERERIMEINITTSQSSMKDEKMKYGAMDRNHLKESSLSTFTTLPAYD
jgi:hypothetical protein